MPKKEQLGEKKGLAAETEQSFFVYHIIRLLFKLVVFIFYHDVLVVDRTKVPKQASRKGRKGCLTKSKLEKPEPVCGTIL